MNLNNKKIICGKKSVIDAIKSNIDIEKIYSIKPLKFKTNIKTEIITKEQMNLLTKLNHQGIIAILKNNFNYFDINQMLKIKPNIILVLDHIEDPHNLGAILRTANAAGIKNIIIPDKRSAQINNTVLKISSGGFVDMNISKVKSIQTYIDKLKELNYWIYATSLTDGQDYTKVKYNFPIVVILGNESKGVSKTLLKMSDQNIYIPMKGTVQSLNVSVATGIILFEIIKKLNL